MTPNHKRFAGPPANGVSDNHQQSSLPPLLRQVAAFGFSQRLTAGPRPRELSRIKLNHPFVRFFFLCYFLTPYLLRFSAQHDPILDPKLAPISPSFDLLFPITFPIRFPTSFWTDFGPQINFKINPKSINQFFLNQPTNTSYFSFIFDQVSKTISCSSKMVDFQKSFQNHAFLFVF